MLFASRFSLLIQYLPTSYSFAGMQFYLRHKKREENSFYGGDVKQPCGFPLAVGFLLSDHKRSTTKISTIMLPFEESHK